LSRPTNLGGNPFILAPQFEIPHVGKRFLTPPEKSIFFKGPTGPKKLGPTLLNENPYIFGAETPGTQTLEEGRIRRFKKRIKTPKLPKKGKDPLKKMGRKEVFNRGSKEEMNREKYKGEVPQNPFKEPGTSKEVLRDKWNAGVSF